MNFASLALAYGEEAPRPFGKRADGSLAGERVFLHWPLLLLTWCVWHLWRLVTRERAFDAVDESLVIGRRLLPSEPPPGAHHYLDLTQEFNEPKEIRERAGYWSFPILDGGAAAPESLVDLALQLPSGRLYVHCAQGHGRTGLVAGDILLATGRAATAEEAMAQVQRARPGVRPNAVQSECLAACERLLRARDGLSNSNGERSFEKPLPAAVTIAPMKRDDLAT